VGKQNFDNTELKKITLSRLRHKGYDRIKLEFAYDVELKDHLKKLVGVRWSKTHGCFYMPDNPDQVKRLLLHIKGQGIWVDQQGLLEKNKMRRGTWFSQGI